MKYSVVGEEKRLACPDGRHLSTDATECEIEFWAEIQRLRAALLNKRGDDLCWMEGATLPLPKEEMLESCRRYVDQLHEKCPALQVGQMTIAQLEAKVAELEEELRGHVDKV